MTTPMAALPAGTQPGRVRTWVAAFAVAIVRAAVRFLPFGLVNRVVSAVNTGRQATRGEVEQALQAVDAAAAFLPFRVACLERSLAGLVLLAARRRQVTWYLGVRQTPPIAMHAWLADTAGVPVAESDLMPTYHTIMIVPPDSTGESPR